MRWFSSKKASRLPVKRIPEKDIAMGCRVRLARNLREYVFPDRATPLQRTAVWDNVRQAVEKEDAHYSFLPIDELPEEMRLLAHESRLISKEFMEGESGAGLVVAKEGSVSAMVNEEDHLRIQGFAPHMDIEDAWSKVDAFDSKLDAHLQYAWTPRLGYLTACPSNLGTGMRVSVMVHLIGLRIVGDLDAAIRGLERMRLLVRGIYGEGSDPSGQIFQISNMDTLGMDEQAILTRMRRICEELIRQERNARARIISESPLIVEDILTRALRLLQCARLMPSGEAMELLSALRFGASVGLLVGLTVAEIDCLMVTVQPAHLQQKLATSLSPEQRDECRAVFLNTQLANAYLKR